MPRIYTSTHMTTADDNITERREEGEDWMDEWMMKSTFDEN